MFEFDARQREVFSLDVNRNARVLGAPGTGKTTLLIESVRRLLDDQNWTSHEVLVMATNRSVGADIRRKIEQVVIRPITGTPVRTAVSLAFALVSSLRAQEGHPPITLMTGQTQDELLRRVIAAKISEGEHLSDVPSEVLITQDFRTELRDVWRVLDDYDGSREQASEADPRWRFACHTIDEAITLGEQEFPNEWSASRVIKTATTYLRKRSNVRSSKLPRLVLVDDAAEITEGELGLLAGLALNGTNIWVFGDPDIATAAYQGERTRVMSELEPELLRREPELRLAFNRPVQTVALTTVYRSSQRIRHLVENVTSRIGAAGAGEQRRAPAHQDEGGRVQYGIATSLAEQVGMIGHRLRSAYFGIDRPEGSQERLTWSRMAVLCRSRAEVTRVSRLLAQQQVPTGQASGGVTLQEHSIVRELIYLLQFALSLKDPEPEDLHEILTGNIGGLDPISMRRLKTDLVLAERRQASAEGRRPESANAMLVSCFQHPNEIVDTREGRALERTIKLVSRAQHIRKRGGTTREALWSIWDGSGLARKLQDRALAGFGARSDQAHSDLDAVMGLFFALQRHEEQGRGGEVETLLQELLVSTVPQDTLARRSERESVTVSTPQGVIGQEFDLVCIVGPQEGIWPNLRPRGSILETRALESFLRSGEIMGGSREDTLHDELRLFAEACSRAKEELLVVSVRNDDSYPSMFSNFLSRYEVQQLPSSRLTLRGLVAECRRRLASNRQDLEAAETLAVLAQNGVPGAHPSEWYGMLPPSADPQAEASMEAVNPVSVRPSEITALEDCPLNWLIGSLGGSSASVASNVGTLMHAVFERESDLDREEIVDLLENEWSEFEFESEWESAQQFRLVRGMIAGLEDYLASAKSRGVEVLAREAFFTVQIGAVELRGIADRIELRTLEDGTRAPVVIDLKTGATKVTQTEVATNPQLLAYQVALEDGAFTPDEALAQEYSEAATRGAENGGASLLYVHPKVQNKGQSYREHMQKKISHIEREQFEERLSTAAHTMSGPTFVARIEHHCQDEHKNGHCRLHIIPPVSHA